MLIFEDGFNLTLMPQEDLLFNRVDWFKKAFSQAIEMLPYHGAVVLDLTQTRQIDSGGILLVIYLFRLCLERQHSLCLEVDSPGICRVFRSCHLGHLLKPVENSVDLPLSVSL